MRHRAMSWAGFSQGFRCATLCTGILLSFHCSPPSGEAGQPKDSTEAAKTLETVKTAKAAHGAETGQAQGDAIRDVLKTRVEALRKTRQLDVRGSRLASVIVLPDLYERRGFRPAWQPRTIDQLFRAIADAEADGLDPRDYHQQLLERLRDEVAAKRQTDAALLADYDLLLTDAVIRLGYHLMFGKVDPERIDANWNMARVLRGFEPALVIQRALDANDVYGALEREKPSHPFYTGLKRELARYRKIDAAGGWPVVPSGPTLRAGSIDARVPALRRRLEATGDLATGADATSTV